MIIIFVLPLTTFEASVIFEAAWGSSEKWLEPKTKPP